MWDSLHAFDPRSLQSIPDGPLYLVFIDFAKSLGRTAPNTQNYYDTNLILFLHILIPFFYKFGQIRLEEKERL